ncbi:MAG: Gfo/Idh/MocA family oxidoreductase, partial [Victivallales bacterium]|nr:Gfo/Idh/MocA family oxidoreductase [Victivallales bacterium]
MLKVAFVGCAHIHTPGFIRMLSERKDVEVAGVCDHDAARAAKNAEATHSRVLPLETILEDASITTVIICSETNRHGELIAKTAAARKHTYAEKPLGFSAKDALVAAKQLNEAGVVFNTGYFQRGLPQNLFIRKLIQDGTLGTITRARYSNCHSGSLGKWFDTDWRWMADPSIAGCGAFGDLGTHALDILMWWFGKPAKVVSDIKVVTGHYGDCDESGEAILVFPNGVTATLAAAWVDVQDPMQSFVSGTKG